MRVRLEEALTPEQKVEVDGWHAPHHEFSDHAFPSPSHLRTFIPTTFGDKGEHEDEIGQHLAKHGMKIHDYVSGTAIDKHGRTVKIGKALGKTEGGHLLDKFTNDPARKSSGSQSDYHVVISRHPHDVAGMTSSGHSWENQSCMNFKTGSNRRYLSEDIRHGTHVAYYAHKDDTELERPLARIALKPFIEIDGNHKILRPESRSYGNAASSFDTAVSAWAHKHFPAKDDVIYKKHHEVYHDSGSYHTVSDKTANDIVTSERDHQLKSDLLRGYPLAKSTVAKVMSGDESHHIVALLQNKLVSHTDDLLAGALRNHKDIMYDAAEHRALGDKTVQTIFDHTYNASERRKSVGFESVYTNLLKNRNFSASHMDEFLNREKGSKALFHPGVMANMALVNPNLKDRHALEIVKRLQEHKDKAPGSTVGPSVHLASANISSETAQKALLPHVEDKHLGTLARNWNLKGVSLDSVIDRAEKSTGVDKSEIAGGLAPKVSGEHMSRLIAMSKDADGRISSHLVDNVKAKNLSPEHLSEILRNGSSKSVSKLVEYADFKEGAYTKEHQDILKNHKDPEVLGAYISNTSSPLGPSDLQHIAESPDHREHLPFLAMHMSNRIYSDTVYHDVSPDTYAGVTNHLLKHKDGLVRMGYLQFGNNAVNEHNIHDVVKNDGMSNQIFGSLMNRNQKLRSSKAVMDYAVDHPNPKLAQIAAGYIHANSELSNHTVDKFLDKNNPSIDYNLANVNNIDEKHVERLGLQALARSAQHNNPPNDASLNRQTFSTVIGHNKLTQSHLRTFGDALKSHLEPMTGDTDILSAESQGVGTFQSSGKLGAYHRLQQHLSSLLYHVNVPEDTLAKLYPHADSDNADRAGEHVKAPYELWKQHIINTGRDVDSVWAKNHTQTQYKNRFRAERLNESVSFGKTKVWILE